MRSIPQAMTWEMLARGKWSLLAAAIGANVFPAILFTALRNQGTIEPDDPSLIIMHVVLMPLIMFIFGSAVFSAQGHPSRLYAFPIPTTTLVTWHLLPAMMLMILESLASTVSMNALFDLRWPLWGPALFLAVAWAAVVAVFWLTEKSGWLIPLMTLVAGGMGLWFKSRYGDAFSLPSRYWTEVTPSDAAVMVAIAVLSFIAAVIGVSRNRLSEPLKSLGITAWLERMFDPALDSGRRFTSPEQAQLWFEWRQKGWAMPVAVGFPLVIVCGIALIFDRNWHSIWEGFVTGGMLLSVVGIVGGLVLGNVSMRDSKYEMGHFLATRPMPTSSLSGVILKTAAKSSLIAWGLWAIAFVTLDLSLQAWEIVPTSMLRLQLRWWFLPATLLGCWTVVGLVTSAC